MQGIDSNVFLTLLCILLAAVAFPLGFRGTDRVLRHRAQAAFIVFVGLALFTGYFAWREHRTVSELARLIEPVPDITNVLYIPTPAEVQTIARTLANVPGERRMSTTPEQRQQLADAALEYESRYWSLATEWSAADILAFYRAPGPRRDWTIATDRAPWLLLERGRERLTIFIQEGWTVSRVWYVYDR